MRLKGPRIVVRADLPSEKIGSIYIPEIGRQQPLLGTVALVGDLCAEVKVGERVLFSSRAWSRFNAPGYGFPYMLLLEKDILGVVE